jgi:hypothetical protein
MLIFCAVMSEYGCRWEFFEFQTMIWHCLDLYFFAWLFGMPKMMGFE